jgi:hypothetical protein
VAISSEDDRINCDQPALLIKAADHEIVADLPWDERPPTVGGFNRFTAKPGSETLLRVERFRARYESGRFQFDSEEQDPMLVIGTHGKGRTAALATDLAPHWVGGLVDWGDGERITAQASGSWKGGWKACQTRDRGGPTQSDRAAGERRRARREEMASCFASCYLASSGSSFWCSWCPTGATTPTRR